LAEIDRDTYDLTNNVVEVDLLAVNSSGEIPLGRVHGEGPIGHVRAALAKSI